MGVSVKRDVGDRIRVADDERVFAKCIFHHAQRGVTARHRLANLVCPFVALAEIPDPVADRRDIRFVAVLLEEQPLQDLRTLPAVIGKQRSEEHTSELQSLMRISYAVFCLNQKNIINNYTSILNS